MKGIDGIGKIKQIKDQVSCLYQNNNNISMTYPVLPSSNPIVALVKPAAVDGWSPWTSIIPAATIDAAGEDQLDLMAVYIDNIPAGAHVYFEVQYNSVTIGRGWLVTGAGAFRVRRNDDFKCRITDRVAGQDLKMRISDDQAGANNYNVGPASWCAGSP